MLCHTSKSREASTALHDKQEIMGSWGCPEGPLQAPCLANLGPTELTARAHGRGVFLVRCTMDILLLNLRKTADHLSL